jgi:TNF receptor-associated factor 2
MCSRLFLNGINDARGTHVSIYFILMRGEYDALLRWPFAFKVSFILLDQSTSNDNQCHISTFFWSNIRSNCFQRPRLEMNEAYGIENFISLKEFRQNQHRYVQNDTMFIKIKVDFTCLASDTSILKNSFFIEKKMVGFLFI